MLSVFLPLINDLTYWMQGPRKILIIDCGYYTFSETQPSFCVNVGLDFITSVYLRCCSNSLNVYVGPVSDFHGKSITVFDRFYRYDMTPFDIRCRLIHLPENDDNEFRYALDVSDTFFECDYGTIVFFNRFNGKLGLACDIDAARKREIKKTENDGVVSDFFLAHRCSLILRDLVSMIEENVIDIDTSVSIIKNNRADDYNEIKCLRMSDELSASGYAHRS